jgi:integrase
MLKRGSFVLLCRDVRKEFDTRLLKDRTSKRHRNTMYEALKKLEARFGNENARTLSGKQIKEWLDSQPWATKTQNKLIGYINNAWNIAVEKGLLASPLGMKGFYQSKKSEIPANPLTPEEAVRLLANAEPSVLPYIAIGMFVRSAEREALDWKDVHFDDAEPYIDLSTKITKTGRKRHVPILPALREFLAPLRPSVVKTEGRIIPLTCNGLPA